MKVKGSIVEDVLVVIAWKEANRLSSCRDTPHPYIYNYETQKHLHSQAMISALLRTKLRISDLGARGHRHVGNTKHELSRPPALSCLKEEMTNQEEEEADLVTVRLWTMAYSTPTFMVLVFSGDY